MLERILGDHGTCQAEARSSSVIPSGTSSRLIIAMPFNRAGSVRLHGRGAVFLASDDGAYVTGVELFLDGGVTHI
jgi:NAD(P)-dependent dehydrogenase (short-subunit alcohol dehydrogenase family)